MWWKNECIRLQAKDLKDLLPPMFADEYRTGSNISHKNKSWEKLKEELNIDHNHNFKDVAFEALYTDMTGKSLDSHQ